MISVSQPLKQFLILFFRYVLPLGIICFCSFVVTGHEDRPGKLPESNDLAGFPLPYYSSCGTSACTDMYYPALLLDFGCYLLLAALLVFGLRRLFRDRPLKESLKRNTAICLWGLAVAILMIWTPGFYMLPSEHWLFPEMGYRDGSMELLCLPWELLRRAFF